MFSRLQVSSPLQFAMAAARTLRIGELLNHAIVYVYLTNTICPLGLIPGDGIGREVIPVYQLDVLPNCASV